MPTVLQVGTFRFFFYSNEGNPREPAHVHVRSVGKEAKVWLQPEIALSANRGFNARELSAIIELVEHHSQSFEQAWNDHFSD